MKCDYVKAHRIFSKTCWMTFKEVSSFPFYLITFTLITHTLFYTNYKKNAIEKDDYF